MNIDLHVGTLVSFVCPQASFSLRVTVSHHELGSKAGSKG